MPMVHKSKKTNYLSRYLKKIYFVLFIYDFTDVKSNVGVKDSMLIANK